jgi:hypothetical protein
MKSQARTMVTERPFVVVVMDVVNRSSMGKALVRKSKIINQPKFTPNLAK